MNFNLNTNTSKKYQNHCTILKQYELLYEIGLFGSVVGCHHPNMNISFNLLNFNIFEGVIEYEKVEQSYLKRKRN